MDTFYRPTWVEVSLDAVHHNVSCFRQWLPPEMAMMAVVKADAYGHGAVEVLREAVEAGATYAGVAFLDEAIELRQTGVRLPILVLGYTPPEAIPAALEHDVTLTVFSQEVLRAAAQHANPEHKLKVHVKLDTGMGRLGLTDTDEAIAFLEQALGMPEVEVEGVYTHFASSDERDKAYTGMQHNRFDKVIAHFAQQGVTFPYVHTGNSAAAIDCPELSYNMVRLGISMYGLYPSEEVHMERLDLQPVMSLYTKPVMVKTVPPGTGISYGVTYRTKDEETIATLPVGYADGYSRMLSGRVEALVQGKRVPVVGRICMDQCMINATALDQVTLDDEVVLMGRQGAECISAENLATLLGTVNYEITCMISHRVPRVYIKNGQRVKVSNPLLR
ncbi:alanine racemase [Paenibacillus sp. HJGM_3]|uniref:alanine racemase n=1 Tax=Paenibacillus sp. HJGM_3 TaxID=3379816 RepID=UPI00385DBCA6